MLRLMVVLGLLAVPAAAHAQGPAGQQIPPCSELHKKYPKPPGMAVCLRLSKCRYGTWTISEACTRWVQPPRTR